MKTLEFLFQEKAIHFLMNPNDKDVMVNATEMAKMFDKRTDHYLQNKETKKIIAALEVPDMSGTSAKKIIDNRGHMGIYFCEILALDFAAWLDVHFKIWIYQTIKDILTAKNKKVASAVTDKQNKIAIRNKLLKQAEEDGNTLALDLIQAEKEIKRLDSLQRKALNELKNQYEIKF